MRSIVDIMYEVANCSCKEHIHCARIKWHWYCSSCLWRTRKLFLAYRWLQDQLKYPSHNDLVAYSQWYRRARMDICAGADSHRSRRYSTTGYFRWWFSCSHACMHLLTLCVVDVVIVCVGSVWCFLCSSTNYWTACTEGRYRRAWLQMVTSCFSYVHYLSIYSIYSIYFIYLLLNNLSMCLFLHDTHSCRQFWAIFIVYFSKWPHYCFCWLHYHLRDWCCCKGIPTRTRMCV